MSHKRLNRPQSAPRTGRRLSATDAADGVSPWLASSTQGAVHTASHATVKIEEVIPLNLSRGNGSGGGSGSGGGGVAGGDAAGAAPSAGSVGGAPLGSTGNLSTASAPAGTPSAVLGAYHRSSRGDRLVAAALVESASQIKTHPLAQSVASPSAGASGVASKGGAPGSGTSSRRSSIGGSSSLAHQKSPGVGKAEAAARRPSSARADAHSRLASARPSPYASHSQVQPEAQDSAHAQQYHRPFTAAAVQSLADTNQPAHDEDGQYHDLENAMGNMSVASWNASGPGDRMSRGDVSQGGMDGGSGGLCDWEADDLREAALAMGANASHADGGAVYDDLAAYQSPRPSQSFQNANASRGHSRMSVRSQSRTTTQRDALASAMETFHLDGVDVESFQEFLAYLRAYQDDCEQRGLYDEALMAQQRIAQTRDEFARHTSSIVSQRHDSERAAVEDAHREALDAFHTEWAGKRALFEDRAADMVAAMRQRHDDDLARFDSFHAEYRPKASKQTQELLKAEYTAARLGQYATAADVQRERLRLESEELQTRWRDRQRAVDKKREIVVAKQEAEICALFDRIDRLRVLGLKNMEAELQRLESRARALRRQLEVSQLHENTELTKTIRTAAVVPLNTARELTLGVASQVGMPIQ